MTFWACKFPFSFRLQETISQVHEMVVHMDRQESELELQPGTQNEGKRWNVGSNTTVLQSRHCYNCENLSGNVAQLNKVQTGFHFPYAENCALLTTFSYPKVQEMGP